MAGLRKNMLANLDIIKSINPMVKKDPAVPLLKTLLGVYPYIHTILKRKAVTKETFDMLC